MKILVVYFEVESNDRSTIREHLNSFDEYSNAECIYVNAFYGIPLYLNLFQFQLVIYHYTFLSQKWNGPHKFNKLLSNVQCLKKITGYKIAMPQDEYVFSDLICRFVKDFKVDCIYTCFYPIDYQKVYPKEVVGDVLLKTTLTGFINEGAIEKIIKFAKPHKERSLDIGYRARKLPFWLGRHGVLKWKITEVFQEKLLNTSLRIDLSNNPKDVFLGDDWYRFLANTRVVLGCEGGASLLDVDGSIRCRVDDYIKSHSGAAFSEVEQECFPDKDGNISLFAISPRHFEACMTKTCQVLVEGKYHGIFKPDVHYIELKKDFSNLDDVLNRIQDLDYCEHIAENAYRDIVLSGEFSYRNFVKEVIETAVISTSDQVIVKKKSMALRGLRLLNYLYVKSFGKIIYTKYRLKQNLFPYFEKTGLIQVYRKLRS